jgi:hypothetical protein
MSASILPDELVWADGGHASDIALSTLADGQSAILPSLVVQHVQGCAACSQHLGHAALLSLHVAKEIGVLAAHDRAEATARRPLPRLAIALGLAVALLALLPTLLDPSTLASSFGSAALLARIFRSVAAAAYSPSSALGLFLTYGTSTALVVSALVVVKLLPKKEVSS